MVPKAPPVGEDPTHTVVASKTAEVSIEPQCRPYEEYSMGGHAAPCHLLPQRVVISKTGMGPNMSFCL